MIKSLVFILVVLLIPACAFAQPQRIERNVARSKATIADVAAERSWKDGELITTQGYGSIGRGANQYRYHASGWSELVSPDGYGFHIRIGSSDAYLEALDKTVARATQFGVVPSSVKADCSAELQACFDAAVATGCEVILPPFLFRAQVYVAATAANMPNIRGISGRTRWRAPTTLGNGDWMLTLENTNSNSGLLLEISNVIFEDDNGAKDCNGVQLVGMRQTKIRQCTFTDFIVGLCTNHMYGVMYDTLTIARNEIGLLNTCRLPASTMVVSGKTVVFEDGLSVTHSGLMNLQSCEFSQNGVGWYHEQPDNSFGKEIECVATNCIFQGVSGLGIYLRTDMSALGPGLTLIGCHFENTVTGTRTIDGETLDYGDLLLNGGVVNVHNSRFVRVRQKNRSQVFHHSPTNPMVGGTGTPFVHTVEPDTLYSCDVVSGYQNTYQNIFSSVVIPSSTSSDTGGLNRVTTRCNPKTPTKSRLSATVAKSATCRVGDLPAKFGSFTMASVADDALPLGYAAACSGVPNNNGPALSSITGHSGGEILYTSFAVRADTDTSLRVFRESGSINATITATSEWKWYHSIGRTSTGSTTLLMLNNSGSTASFEVAEIQNVQFANLHDAIEYQRANAFYLSDSQWNLLYGGHAQISIEDNATATTVASTQSDWSAKSQFTLFGTNFADSINATPDHTNDHITLTSAGTWEVSCVVTLSGSVVSDLWELALWKNNGATQVSTKQGVNIRGAGLTYEKQVTISGLVDASANDTIELWVQRTNGTGTLTITNAVMTAKKVSD